MIGKVILGFLTLLGVGVFVGTALAQPEDRRRPISKGDEVTEAPSGEAQRKIRRPISPALLGDRIRARSQALMNPHQLLFKTDRFDPLERGPHFPVIGPGDLTAKAYAPGGKHYYLVQYTGTIHPLWFEWLIGTGAEVLAYVPNNAYLVRIDAAHRSALEQLPDVRWVGDFHPGYKIDPALPKVIETKAGTEEVVLGISTFRDRSAGALRWFLEGLDPSVRIWHSSDTAQGRGRILLYVKVASLGKIAAALAAHPDIEWIEEHHLPQLTNDDSIWAIQSGNQVTRVTPIWDHGITGFGQIYGAADSGIDTDACQMRFSSSAGAQTLLNTTQPPGVNITDPGNKILTYYLVGAAEAYDDTNTGFHGTHTTGNAVGDNFTSLATASNPAHDFGDGMAPAATVVFQDVGQSDGSLDGLAVGQTDLQQQAHDSGARIHNDSYGVPATAVADSNEYDIDSRDLDEVIWRLRHYTVFSSAGNAGPAPGGLGLGGSTAKNTLSVAATDNGSQGAEGLASFSSHGSTSDGRFKPDMAAPGQSINSATENAPVGSQSQTDPPNNNCATSPSSGTSFASPTLAGAGLLTRQYFTDGFYPSGVATPADGFDPSNALVKAALINSGRNLTGQFTASDGTGGASGPLPNFGQGWGRVTLDDILFFPGDSRELRVLNDALNGMTTVVPPAVTISIETGQTHQFMLENVSTVEDLRVTLNWSDPAGSIGSGVVLVNNLDLEVVDPLGVLYKGNVNFVDAFSTAAGAAPADNLNTLENVYIEDPVPGTYTVRVIGTNVPGNGTTSPFNSNLQGYALIATGNFSAGNGPLIRLESVSITGGKGDDTFLDRTEALDVAVTVRNHGSTEGFDSTVTLSVDAGSEVPTSAVVISPLSINYGSIASKTSTAETFSIALLDDGIDYSNQRLLVRVDATASGAPATSDVSAIETMADSATIPLFDGFESGLTGWNLTKGSGGPSAGPGLVTCETSGAARPTPLNELKLGRLNCTSAYRNKQDQRAFSPTFSVPLANNTRLESLNFWHRLGTESFFDFAQVFFDHDNDGTFNFLEDFNGPDMGEMRSVSFPFPEFFNTGRSGDVAVLFRLITDMFVTDFPGWFVDDVSVTTKSSDPIADSTPSLIAVSPSTGAQGTVGLNLTITGLNTGFINGDSVVSFAGGGITVNSTTVTSPSEATANITIDAGAALGLHALTVTTGAEVVTRSILFRVVPSSLSVQVTPSTWELGTISKGSIVTSWTSTTPVGGGFFTTINDGSLTEDLTIRVAASASWSPGTTPGVDTFSLGWGQTVVMGTEPPFTNITTPGVPLTNGLAPSDSFKLDLEFQSPTSTSDFSEQLVITTVVAQAS